MRWVNPSIATVSPSRTRSATASRIEATLPGMSLRSWAPRLPAGAVDASGICSLHPRSSVAVARLTARAACRSAPGGPEPLGREPGACRRLGARRRRRRGARRRAPRPRRRSGPRSRPRTAARRAAATSGRSRRRPRGPGARGRTPASARRRRSRPSRTRCRSSGPCRGRPCTRPGNWSTSGRRPSMISRPRMPALAIRPPSSRRIVSSRAARATGLPP